VDVSAEATSVLVIDDDLLTRVVLSDQLSGAGYRVHLAEDGEQGLLATREHRPELVVCDWAMPGIDGLEYCRRIKADPALGGVQLVMLTGRGDSADRVTGLDAGADDFLVKPIDAEELLARVRAGLRLRAIRRELVEYRCREAVARVAELGHDINNPLTALFGHLQLLLQHLENEDRPRMLHHIRAAREVADRIAEIGHQLNAIRIGQTPIHKRSEDGSDPAEPS
jgi:DNA-binding response OmpR family regulator